jgi:uncharacterized membrane protein
MDATNQPSAVQPANAAPIPGRQRLMILGILGGMVPILLAIVPFAMGLWGIGLVIVVGGNALIIGSRVLRHQSNSVLDYSSLGLGVLLVIAYFGFGNLFFLQHFGVVIYTLLLAQVVDGELRGAPFTAQYAKQMYPPAVQGTPTFFEANRFLSRLWGALFFVGIILSAVGTSPLTLIVIPNVLVILGLVRGPAIAHAYAIRFLPPISSPAPRLPK